MNENKFSQKASKEAVEKTRKALEENGFATFFVETGEEAKKKVFELIPENAEVMNMASVTLDTLGISQEIMESGKYNSVKKKLSSMNRETQNSDMQKLGSASDWSIGSVHSITEDGKVIIASRSGSQLPGYAFGSTHVIWVVGTQKIVSNLDEGMKRIYEYTLPLESERVKKAYGLDKSEVSKLLIINNEVPGRITIIFVDEVIGY